MSERSEGYPGSLALCVLDALWTGDADSPGADAMAVMAMYRELRAQDWGDADTDGIRALAAQVAALGGPAYWTEQVKLRDPSASTRAELLRANAMVEACDLLSAFEVDSVTELRALDEASHAHLQRPWKRMAGQRSGRSFERLLRLAGA